MAGLIALVTAVGLGACSRDDFGDRTAVVSAGDRTVDFTIDSCGLDGSTLFVVGRSDAGEILQAVIALADDGASGDPAATGVTFDVGVDTYGAFGPTAWSRRAGAGAVPGHISWARLRGARIQFAGEADPVDEDGRAVTGGGAEPVRFDVDARCDERDTP